jgi:hypothetical protein
MDPKEASMNAVMTMDLRDVSRTGLRWLAVPIGIAAAVAGVWFIELPQAQVNAATIVPVEGPAAWSGDPSVPSASDVRFDSDAGAADREAPTF